MPAPGTCQVKDCKRLASSQTVPFKGKRLRVCAVCHAILTDMIAKKARGESYKPH